MKGKIDKMVQYKSGRGYFIGIAGTDYMFFGNPKVKYGDQVEFVEGRPTKDGKPTIKEIHTDTIEAFIDEDKPRSAQIPFRAHDTPQTSPKDSREEYWKAKEKRDLEREPIEIRLRCLESACNFYSGEAVMHEDIFRLVKKLEAYAKGENV